MKHAALILLASLLFACSKVPDHGTAQSKRYVPPKAYTYSCAPCLSSVDMVSGIRSCVVWSTCHGVYPGRYEIVLAAVVDDGTAEGDLRQWVVVVGERVYRDVGVGSRLAYVGSGEWALE